MTTSNEVTLAVEEMHEAHRSIKEAERAAVRAARRCATKMSEIKAHVGARDWPAWVAEHANFNAATAGFYEKLAHYTADGDPAKISRLESMSLREVEMIVNTAR